MRVTLTVTVDRHRDAVKLLKKALNDYKDGVEDSLVVNKRGDYSIRVLRNSEEERRLP